MKNLLIQAKHCPQDSKGLFQANLQTPHHTHTQMHPEEHRTTFSLASNPHVSVRHGYLTEGPDLLPKIWSSKS